VPPGRVRDNRLVTQPRQPGFRSGFACFAGRPNVGKSTLMNALVGSKIAITSSRPQTTRRAIRGIVHRPDAQLIIIDTPGLHRPRTLLGERLDSLARSTLTEVDVIGFCVPAADRIGPGDTYLASELAGIGKTPVVAIVTKTDQAPPERVAAQLAAVAALDDLTDVHAWLYVERPSQKSIVIGAKGARLKDVGRTARRHIEALLGTRVYLDLRIKVAKDWQRDPKQLRRLGFYD